MKTELNNPIFVEINFRLFDDKHFIKDVGSYLANQLGLPQNNKIRVSSCWVNPSTYALFRNKVRSHLLLSHSSKYVDKVIGWLLLDIGFAEDVYNRFNIPDNVIAVEDGYLV